MKHKKARSMSGPGNARGDYFLRAYLSESRATAKMMMPPLMMYCQYGFTPM